MNMAVIYGSSKTKKISFFLILLLLLLANTAAFGQETQVFQGSWSNVSKDTLALQFFFNSDGAVSATLLVFSGNKCYIETMEGPLGIGRTKVWEGTFRVDSRNQTLDLIDDFGDADRYRYVFSETIEEQVLKLKDTDGDITTWYKSKS